MKLRKTSPTGRRPNRMSLGRFETLEPRVVLDARLLITEFVADNDNSALDEDGDDPDWVELFNVGDEAVNVEGWHLTDDPTDLGKYELGSRVILPGEFLVVFASGKDRDDPLIGNLHTNFQLSSAGGYLALTRPDESIAFEYANYPAQVEDVGYGIPSTVTQTTLVREGAAGKVFVPTNGSIDPDLDNEIIEGSWIDPAFNDSAWSNALLGVGYWDESVDPNPQPGEGEVIANSVTEFSGTQAADNWRYGYWNEGGDNDGVFDATSSEFRQFLNVPVAFLNNWDKDEMIWDMTVRTTNPQATTLTSEGSHPSGSNTGELHQTVRRWEAEIDGGVLIHGTINNPDSAGDGVVARILIEGTEVYRTQLNGNSVNYKLIRQVREGQRVDFVLGTGELGNNVGDNTQWSVTIEDVTPFVGELDGVPTLTENITTDIEAQMKGIGSSAYIRIPFTPVTTDFDSLALRVQYQDGFIAYINGQEVARSTSAGDANGNFQTLSDSERTVEEAKIFESFNVTSGLDLLSPGVQNVLMIQALNVSNTDDDLLLVPELIGTKLVVDETDVKYFLTATAGEQNGLGTDAIGPLFRTSTHSPNVPKSTDPIVVTTDVATTFAAVSNVMLNYRVMYGNTTQIPMVDNGTGADAVAGDGVYTATIPGNIGQGNQMVRWFMTGADINGNQSRFPTFVDSRNSEEYKGTVYVDAPIDSNLPVLQTFFQTPNAANNDTGAYGSLFYNGEFYDNINMNLHGQSSRSFPKRSYDVFLPEDHRFTLNNKVPTVSKFNLLSNYADKSKLRNSLGHETRRLTGAAYHVAFPVRVEQNGSFFGVVDYVEDAEAAWLERMGLDPKNQLYKLYNTFNTASGAEKKTAKSTGNEDLVDFIAGLSQTGNAGRDFVYDNVNLAAMANYLAGFMLTADTDCCHKNYYTYRDDSGSGEWWFFDWDVDLSYGRNWGGFGLSYHDYTIYFQQGLRLGTNNTLVSKLYAIPEFAEMYNRRVRTIFDEVFGGPDDGNTIIEDYIQKLVDQIGADGPADHAKWGQVSSASPQQPFETWPEAVAKITDLYLDPRRGYIDNLSAIPASQTPNAVIEITGLDYNPVSGIQDEEYLQLTNNNAFSVDITGWELKGGVKMTFQPGTVIKAGGSLYVTPSAKAFRARATGPSGGQSLFVQGGYSGHLSNLGETIELTRANGTMATSFSYVGDSSPAQRFLRISEVMYNPLGPSAEELAINASFDNDDFEYAELTNISTTDTLDLANVRFTSGFQFDFTGSSVTSLAPGGRVLVVKDRAAFNARYGNGMNSIIAGEFSDGSLNNAGEAIKLDDATNSTIVEFTYSDNADSGWPELADGRGSSLQIINVSGDYGDPTNWRASTEINGSAGVVGLPAPTGLVINEVISNTDLPAVDQIELLNTSNSPISLGNYYLSDRAANVADLQRFKLPSTTLAPGAYVVFSETQLNFGLSSFEDEVYLTVGDGSTAARFADFVKFGAITAGESYGRSPNASGALVPMTATTFGATNSSPRIGPVIISELQYNPGEPTAADLAIDPTIQENDLEFVEIHNTSASQISLTNWRVRGGVDLDFDEGSTLAAGETVVVVSFNPDNPLNADRVDAFRHHYGIQSNVRLIGGYGNQLSDSGERVTLQRPGTPSVADPLTIPRFLEDEVRYSDSAPWTTNADGTGSSLTRVSTSGLGNNSTSWIAATPTPGAVNFGNLPGDVNQDGIVNAADIDDIFNAIRTGGGAAFDVDNSGVVNSDDVKHLVENILHTWMGDANLDGAVSVEDLNRVGIGWQQMSGAKWSTGDFTGDGAITSADLTLVGLNWRKGTTQAAAVRSPRAPLAAAGIPVSAAQVELVNVTLGRDQQRMIFSEDSDIDAIDSSVRHRAFNSMYARRQFSSRQQSSPLDDAVREFPALVDSAISDWELQ